MGCFPFLCGNHLDGVPGTAVEKRAVGAFAGAFLAADAEVRIDFDAAEGRMVFVRYPEHAGFYRAVFDTGGRARATRAAIRGDGQYSWLLLARRFTVARRHGPMFFDDLDHALSPLEDY